MKKSIINILVVALYTFLVYQQVIYTFPLQRIEDGKASFISKDNPLYYETLKLLPRYTDYMEKVEPLIASGEIRSDVVIYEEISQVFGQAKGTSVVGSSDAVVEMVPGFYGKDPDAASFIMYHELGHLKANDLFSISFVASATAVSGYFIFSSAVNLWGACIIAPLLYKVSISFFSQWREGLADDYAIEKSSVEELLGGRRYMKTVQKLNLDLRGTSFTTKLFTTESGEYLLDFMHPSLASRIVKIENALVSRSITINEEEEALKIVRLRSLWL